MSRPLSTQMLISPSQQLRTQQTPTSLWHSCKAGKHCLRFQKRTGLSNVSIICTQYRSGSSKNCALILQETISSDPSPLLGAEAQALYPGRRSSLRARENEPLVGHKVTQLSPVAQPGTGDQGHNPATASSACAGLKELFAVLIPRYFTDDGWFWPRSGAAFLPLCSWERSTAPPASKSLSER